MRKNKYPIPDTLSDKYVGNYLRVKFGKRKVNSWNLTRKSFPYGEKTLVWNIPDCEDVSRYGMQSKWGRIRNRKATRRMQNKVVRMKAKKDVASRLAERPELLLQGYIDFILAND